MEQNGTSSRSGAFYAKDQHFPGGYRFVQQHFLEQVLFGVKTGVIALDAVRLFYALVAKNDLQNELLLSEYLGIPHRMHGVRARKAREQLARLFKELDSWNQESKKIKLPLESAKIIGASESMTMSLACLLTILSLRWMPKRGYSRFSYTFVENTAGLSSSVICNAIKFALAEQLIMLTPEPRRYARKHGRSYKFGPRLKFGTRKELQNSEALEHRDTRQLIEASSEKVIKFPKRTAQETEAQPAKYRSAYKPEIKQELKNQKSCNGVSKSSLQISPPDIRNITLLDLRTPERLLSLFEQSAYAYGLEQTEANRLHFVAAFVCARRKKQDEAAQLKRKQPDEAGIIKLFVWIVKNRAWDRITQEDEDYARQKLTAYLNKVSNENREEVSNLCKLATADRTGSSLHPAASSKNFFPAQAVDAKISP